MAPWQFKTKLIPRPATNVANRSSLEFLSDDQPEAAWAHFDAIMEIKTAVSELLPAAESWSVNATMLGDSKLDQLEVWTNEGGIAWISISFNMGCPNYSLVAGAIKLAQRFGCVFVDVQAKLLFEPTPEEFISRSLLSTSSRFGTLALNELLDAMPPPDSPSSTPRG